MCSARMPWLLHSIYTIVWVAPVLTTQLGSGLYTSRPENPVYLCYDSIQNVPGKPTPLTPLKVHCVILLACGAWPSEVTICALFPAQVGHEVCRALRQGCAAPSREGSRPLNTLQPLHGLLEPCLLWCLPSAPGNDSHFECQPARNR